ncbi:MAG: FtsW/RodA/SpoVE family cell cycle protein [Prevotella bivia]|uniref:Probable peptidoglycan glycosyltransferase FtsW n=2 Tax=Prevotella bivia TaxID=28125 RepID=I4Z8M9_9BACT|nr:FtsW/RodA/SpoVE family cell cycle protein [Prevotella bivia]EFB93376.1 cell cycle protein, FtsW/RodA/SpoVE family [Prevotella bivia JCVIHMP010]EIM32571.1 bacterial cell division membrane protein [Prevotella bivia DSM 20514]KGF45694.1 rod shape-determining protein RodA [Prevotella bivia DNF00320]MDK7761938.1 FtsW/RodA/SpoVE family cell cycle protein [Prevotella bivia]MDU2114038.1 FtsW/RodA/SpoVE family cell cycle protein [Prevotella bivia]
MNVKSLQNVFKGDKVVWMIFFFLCMISIIEVYSASSSLSYKGGNFWGPIIYHTVMLAIGWVAMVFVLNVECRYFKLATPIFLIVSVFLLYIVMGIGSVTNGASRWISIFGIQFQPSELGKGALIMTIAQLLSAMQTDYGADRKAIKYILFVSGVVILPIFSENLSTAALLFLTVIFMMVIGRVSMKQIGKLMGVIFLFVALGLAFVMFAGNSDNAEVDNRKQNLTEQTAKRQEQKKETGIIAKVFHRADTWKARINKFFNHKYVAPKDFDLDKDAQVAHANIAIASSNIVGKGPGNSNERDFLSQAFSDFIYAIIIEEMGILGAFVVLALYVILFIRVGIIARRCENSFPTFLAMGLAFLLVSQAMFNMAVAVGLAPVTGQPLPLISKGGTSSIINCVYIGAILSISRSAKRRTNSKKEENHQGLTVTVANA